MQKDIDKQVSLLKKVTRERDEARSEANESQQSARILFNEQKRLVSQMDRMKDEVSRSNKAVDKMREETIRLRSKVNELRDEKSDLQKQHESHIADEESAARERETVSAGSAQSTVECYGTVRWHYYRGQDPHSVTFH